MSKSRAFHPIVAMEDDILAVGRWAGILSHLGAGHTAIEPGELWVISRALIALGKRLEADWKASVDEARSDQ